MNGEILDGRIRVMQDSAIMGYIKYHDWEGTPLGVMERWPPSLKVSLDICLSSPFPMLICWGPELIMLYNDGYTKFLDTHNGYGAVGKPAGEVWAGIWDDIGPMLEGVKKTGEPVYLEDRLFPLKRNGVLEDRFFTFSYSAIRD